MDAATGSAVSAFSSQAGLASLRDGAVLVQCDRCPAELGVPDDAWIVWHLSDGTHEALRGPRA